MKYTMTILACILGLFLAACQNTSQRSSSGEVQSEPKDTVGFQFLSFNILYSTKPEQTQQTIAELKPEIVALQECSEERMAAIAEALGYQYHSFAHTKANMSDHDTGFLSSWPIAEKTTDGIVVQHPEAGLVAFFNVHLSAHPYEPYDFRDGKINTPEQAVQSAAAIRIPQINTVLKQMAAMTQRGIPVFLAGDFNEASHLDWTHEAASAGKNFGHRVEWPVSAAIVKSGMEDAYRSLFPSSLTHPGITWTPWKHTENEVFDRIDIIYHQSSAGIKVKNARIVGKDDGDIRLPFYDSDHYALLITYQLTK